MAANGGGMRRVHLRGRENIAKRYLIHTAAFNLGLIMRKLTGFGTPKGWAAAQRGVLWPLGGLWNRLWVSVRVWLRLHAALARQTPMPHESTRAA